MRIPNYWSSDNLGAIVISFSNVRNGGYAPIAGYKQIDVLHGECMFRIVYYQPHVSICRLPRYTEYILPWFIP